MEVILKGISPNVKFSGSGLLCRKSKLVSESHKRFNNNQLCVQHFLGQCQTFVPESRISKIRSLKVTDFRFIIQTLS